MNARYYDPVVGRFMAIDPVGPLDGGAQHLNRYAYAYNNPYRYTDPTGLQGSSPWGGPPGYNMQADLVSHAEYERQKPARVAEARKELSEGLGQLSSRAADAGIASAALGAAPTAAGFATVSAVAGMASALTAPNPVEAVALEVGINLTVGKVMGRVKLNVDTTIEVSGAQLTEMEKNLKDAAERAA